MNAGGRGDADTYPFLAFSELTFTLKTDEKMFSGCIVPSDSKEAGLESSDQEASPLAGKNTKS